MNSINSQDLSTRMIPIAISVITIFAFLLVIPPLTHGEEPFFSIALSNFSKEEDARKEEAKLKNSGNNAFYKKEKNKENGNIEFQVYIEKFKSMEEAIKEAKVLKDLELISDYLVKEVVDTPIIEEPPPETLPEGTEPPQPDGETKQVPEVKTGVPENKVPVTAPKTVEGTLPLAAQKEVVGKIPETKPVGPVKQTPEQKPAILEGQTKITGQKDGEKKTPATEAKKVANNVPDSLIKKVDAPSQPAEKKENVKNVSEAVPKELAEKILLPEQEKTSGQIRREPIPIQKETVKQAIVSEKSEELAHTTDQDAKVDRVLKQKNIEPQAQIPEKVPEKKVPVSGEIVDQSKGVSLQVGACKEEANAAILKKQLTTLGRNAFYRHEAATGMGDIYRIYITGYSTLGDAVKDAKALVESGVITGYARPNSKNPAANMPPQKTEAAPIETGNSIYLLHTGSYKEEVNAQRAVALLKESGYKAIFVPEKEATVTWYRVYIGDFRSEAQAREKGLELLDKGVITYFKPVAITPQEKATD